MNTALLIISIVVLIAGGFWSQKNSTPPKPATPTPTPTSSPTVNESLVYPNAIVIISSDDLLMESTDDPDVISEWYKNKIKSMGFNVKSFVATKTNGNVENVFVGAKSGSEIRVTITKNAEELKTRIVVAIKTS